MLAEPWLIALYLLYITIIVIVFSSNIFSFLDKGIHNRNKNIDGLRFFLAIGVAFHHSIVLYSAFHSPTFDFVTQGYPILWRVGRYAVAAFFMVSAYLFADRIEINRRALQRFWVGRFFRILPGAYFSVFLCFSAAALSGYHSEPVKTLSHLGTWKDALLAPFIAYQGNLSFLLAPSVGVLWTLAFEWGLYLALPLVTVLRDKVGKLAVSIVAILVCVGLMQNELHDNYRFILCFALGIFAKDLRDSINIKTIYKDLMLVICISYMFFSKNDPISTLNLSVEFFAFLLIVTGTSLSRILGCKGVVRLGEISYSIYLAHGPILFLLTYLVSMKIRNKYLYDFMILPTLLSVCILSSVIYHVIERPGISFGKRFFPKRSGLQ